MRTLLRIVLVSAILPAWIRRLDSVGHALVVITYYPMYWLLVATGSVFLARSTGWVIQGRRIRFSITLICTILLGIIAYLWWAHFRSIYRVDYLDHGFPYPDPAILALERWYDARYPIRTPGSLKMHGEFPRVRIALGHSILILETLNGLLFGLLSNGRLGKRSRADSEYRPERVREESEIPSWKHRRTILLLPGMVTLSIPGTIL